MKNKIIISLVCALSIIGLTGCDKDTTAGFTSITNYPSLTLKGSTTFFTAINQPFVDPGFTAELNGVDVSDEIEVVSDVDTNVAGIYTVSYTATSPDGFKFPLSRTVYVADLTPSVISLGYHSVAVGTYRLRAGVTIKYSGYDILIMQVSPGEFYISDFLGGYYDQRAGYGANYACKGKFKLNADNTLTLVESSVAGWQDSLTDLVSGIYDPAAGTLSWNAKYAGMDFNVIITL